MKRYLGLVLILILIATVVSAEEIRVKRMGERYIPNHYEFLSLRMWWRMDLGTGIITDDHADHTVLNYRLYLNNDDTPDADSLLSVEYPGYDGVMNNYDHPGTADSGWGVGPTGACINFDGDDGATEDWIVLDDLVGPTHKMGQVDFSLWEGMTFDFWFKTDGSTGYYMDKRAVTGSHTYMSISANRLWVRMAGPLVDVFSTTLVNTDQWHHVTVVKDYVKDILLLFIDGEWEAGTGLPLNTNQANAVDFYLGRYAGSTGFATKISYANYRLYAHARYPDEIETTENPIETLYPIVIAATR